jgi:hypothetical protein
MNYDPVINLTFICLSMSFYTSEVEIMRNVKLQLMTVRTGLVNSIGLRWTELSAGGLMTQSYVMQWYVVG